MSRYIDANDLISRQAAIKVIDAVFPVDPMKSEYAQGIACGAALAKTYVEQLPTAQPEIIKCKDCMYGKQDDDGWWSCISFGCQVGNGDGSGFCADAERRTDEQIH